MRQLNPKDYLISQNGQVLAGPGFRSVQQNGITISTGPHLCVYPFHFGKEKISGWVVGWLFNASDGLVADGQPLPLDKTTRFQDWSLELTGRYFLVFEAQGKWFFRPDPFATVTCCFSPKTKQLASVPGIADPKAQRTQPCFEPGDTHKSWQAFGLTNRADVQRLLPNHQLDLETMTPRRIWPLATTERSACNRDQIALRIAQNTQHLAKAQESWVHLTAGWDSRMLLAGLQNCQDRPQIGTMTIANIASALSQDQITARALAKLAGVRYHEVLHKPANPKSVRDWYQATDHCLNDTVAQLSETLEQVPKTVTQISGLGGEFLRAFYWSEADINTDRPDIRTLLRRLDQPNRPEVQIAAQNWLANLPPLNTPQIWDLAYMEHRMGCWAAPALFGVQAPIPPISPFNDAKLLRELFATAPKRRTRNALARDVIGELAPDLLSLPVNAPFGLDRLRRPQASLKAFAKTHFSPSFLSMARVLKSRQFLASK